MKSRWPTFTSLRGPGGCSWTGSIRPAALSEEYALRVRYFPPARPKVEVLVPVLHTFSAEEPIPDRFGDGSLCLYHPKYGEWTPRHFIANTIIPWAALWLVHYEYWHASGVWHGGGEHPE